MGEPVIMPQRLPPERLRALFSGLVLAMLLAALDSTIVATALPTIVAELGGLNRLAWVVTAYLLAQTIAIPLYGKLGDLYGRKRVLQAAIVIFLAGSALCGMSVNMWMLIACRVVQGLGGGGLIVTSQAAIGDVVSPRDRGRYQGVMGAAFGVASVAGPLLGGFFTTALTWRWIFYINLPLGLAALAAIGATLPTVRRLHRARIDYAGAASLSLALASIVLLTDLAGLAYPWSSWPIVGLAVIAIAAVIAFVRIEQRASEPILPMRLMCQATFVSSIIVSLAAGFALFGSATYLPLFLQVVRGSAPTMSGLEMMPIMAGTLFSSIVAGQLITRYGRYRAFPILGTATATIGLLLLGRLQPDTPQAVLVGYMLTLGLGLGMVTQVLVTVAQNTSRAEDLGVTTSGVTLFRLIGGSLGTAILGTVFSSQVAGVIDGGTINPTALGSLDPVLLESVKASITGALASVFHVAAAVAGVGFVFAWFIPEKPLRRSVAAATANPGRESGDAFAMPRGNAAR